MDIKSIQSSKEQDIFKALFDAAPDAMVIVDRKGYVQMVNWQTEKLFGYLKNELIGHPVDLLMPEAIRLDHNNNRKFLKEPGVRSTDVRLELEAIRKDGTKFPVDLGSPNMDGYYGPRNNNSTIINNTTVVNRTYKPENGKTEYVAGPDRESIEKATGKQIRPVTVTDGEKPGERLSGNEFSLYRPQVSKAEANGESPAPRKVVELKDVRPVDQKEMNESRNSSTPNTPKEEEPLSVTPRNDGDLIAPQPSSKEEVVGPDRYSKPTTPRKIKKDKSPKR